MLLHDLCIFHLDEFHCISAHLDTQFLLAIYNIDNLLVQHGYEFDVVCTAVVIF